MPTAAINKVTGKDADLAQSPGVTVPTFYDKATDTWNWKNPDGTLTGAIPAFHEQQDSFLDKILGAGSNAAMAALAAAFIPGVQGLPMWGQGVVRGSIGSQLPGGSGNILQGAITGGAMGEASDYFGVGTPSGTVNVSVPSDYAWSDGASLGTNTPNFDISGSPTASLYADGLGGVAPSGYTWTPEGAMSNIATATPGSPMTPWQYGGLDVNGNPIDQSGMPTTGLEGGAPTEFPGWTPAATAAAGPSLASMAESAYGTPGLSSMPNASTFGNTMAGAGVLGTGLLATGGFTGAANAATAGGISSLLPSSLAGYAQAANAILGIGSGVAGIIQANHAGDAATAASAAANPWATSGGQALATQQLQELMTNPSQTAARDPSFGLAIQGAQRATASHGQDSGAMAVAAANASNNWYNNRLSTLGTLAGAPGNPVGAAQVGLLGSGQSNQLLMQALSSIGFGVNQALGGSSQLPASLLQQLLLARS